MVVVVVSWTTTTRQGQVEGSCLHDNPIEGPTTTALSPPKRGRGVVTLATHGAVSNPTTRGTLETLATAMELCTAGVRNVLGVNSLEERERFWAMWNASGAPPCPTLDIRVTNAVTHDISVRFYYKIFKILGLLRTCPWDETIYVDNDVTLNVTDEKDLFAPFETMREENQIVGVTYEISRTATKIPPPQGGVLFLRCGAGAEDFLVDWANRFIDFYSCLDRDGHQHIKDQPALSDVLQESSYRNRTNILPPIFNCRPSRTEGRIVENCILVHNHRKKDDLREATSAAVQRLRLTV